MWRILLVIVGLVLIPPSIQAEKPSESQLQEWVKQLGSSQYSERQQAERELATVGVAALPALNSARDSIDPEQRSRVRTLLERIEQIQGSEPLQVARKFQLQYRNQPLAVVVEDLKKQTELPLILSQDKVQHKSRLITLEAKDLPLWQVVDRLCEAADLHEDFRPDVQLPAQKTNGTTSYFSNGQGMVFTNPGMTGQSQSPLPGQVPLILADGKRNRAPGVRSGRVRVIAMEGDFPSNKILRGVGQVLISLDIAPDPQLNWQEVTHVRINKAEDVSGRPVFPHLISSGDAAPGQDNVFWGGGQVFARRQAIISSQVDTDPSVPGVTVANPRLTHVALRTDDRDIRMLRHLEGVVIGEIHQPNTPITTIDNLFQNQGNTHSYVDQSNLTIQSATLSADGETAVRIRMETLQPWIQQQMLAGRMGGRMGARIEIEQNIGNMLSKLQFYRADGKLCKTPTQTSTRYMGDNIRQSLETELRFSKSDKPVKLVRIGTKISPMEVPFKLENVRMP